MNGSVKNQHAFHVGLHGNRKHGARKKENTRNYVSLQLYTKDALHAHKRAYEYMGIVLRRYYSHRKLNPRGNGDNAMDQIHQALTKYCAEINEDFAKLTGHPCQWKPEEHSNPNRNQFDIKAEVVTKSDLLFLKCLVIYDTCLVDLLERGDEDETKKVKRFKFFWKRSLLRITGSLLRKIIGEEYFTSWHKKITTEPSAADSDNT